MIKIKKKLLLISLILGLLSFGGIAYASGKDKAAKSNVSTDMNVNEVIKLANFEIPTTFTSNKINVKYEDIEGGIKAVVTDKKSKKILASYSEGTSEEDKQGDDKIWRSHLVISSEINPVTIIVYTELIVSQKQGLKPQIESIPYVYQAESNITDFEIKNPHESVRNSQDLPTDNVILNITGQIYSTSDMNRKSYVTYNDFKTAGFDMNGSEKKEWFARKDYNSQVTFKLKTE
ncbi:hypothetical protein JZO86_16740 [Enterococcus ureasiticus]|uniref:hypothetical protein n=1 Tax=Enterococcus ureasiticus TaxID=903984 RepID=UPI001A8D3E78|nr:hypothetical protein [Enterococcus ureasiticus]MBO0475327.1 hypothetical protein [Enterococcus ureasiticus]